MMLKLQSIKKMKFTVILKFTIGVNKRLLVKSKKKLKQCSKIVEINFFV